MVLDMHNTWPNYVVCIYEKLCLFAIRRLVYILPAPQLASLTYWSTLALAPRVVTKFEFEWSQQSGTPIFLKSAARQVESEVHAAWHNAIVFTVLACGTPLVLVWPVTVLKVHVPKPKEIIDQVNYFDLESFYVFSIWK